MIPHRIDILHPEQTDRWREYLDRLPGLQQDVFMAPEYYALFETRASRGECFAFTSGQGTVIYPYLKTDIRMSVDFAVEDRLFDLEGAYGYNGLIGDTDSEAVLEAFSHAFKGYCTDQGVIAEFVRFNPLLGNHRRHRNVSITPNNKNIVVDLSPPLEDIWNRSYRPAARKNVKTAERSGLTTRWFFGSETTDPWIDRFLAIYYDTMDRRDAHPMYYFRREFIRSLSRSLGRKSLFFFTLRDETPVSCEIVLLSRCVGYSFLGGTRPEAFPLRPNNLLKHKIIKTLKEMGFAWFCLGGGSKVDDGVYRYKKTFSRNSDLDFFIGKGIHHPTAYERICRLWEERFPEKRVRYANILLKYRY